jgi:hypothetical protein
MRIIQVYELECLSEYELQVQTLISITQLVKKLHTCLGIHKVRKANDSGLPEIVNVAGMHSLRRTAVIEIFENKQDLRLARFLLGHKKTYSTTPTTYKIVSVQYKTN